MSRRCLSSPFDRGSTIGCLTAVDGSANNKVIAHRASKSEKAHVHNEEDGR